VNRNHALAIATASILLVLAASILWERCRRPGLSPRIDRPPETKVEDSESSKGSPRRPLVRHGRSDSDRGKLQELLRKLGRAVVVRDRRTYDELRAAPPSLYESDVPWLLERLEDELFVAAGAAELVSWFGLAEAVPKLAAMIRGAAHPAAKDVAVRALGTIGGDGAMAALLEILAANSDASMRTHAASALARFQGPEVYRALVDALRDVDPDVRRAAAEALQSLPSKDLLEILLARLPEEPDPRAAAELALAAYTAGRDDALPRIYAALDRRPDVAASLRDRLKLDGSERYRRKYESDYFRAGGEAVRRSAGMRRIGITVEPGAGATLDVIRPLFRQSPIDRYRDFFYCRIESEFASDIAAGIASPRAYDVEGNPILGGLPQGPLDGTVHLRFREPKEFSPGILGFTEGRAAAVTAVSLLHEFGHAFARLADEYDHALASNADEANVDLPDRKPKWQALIDRGILGEPRPRGNRVIPSDTCHMNNRPTDDRWCAVCQLEMIAKICEAGGAPVPW